MLWTTLQMKKYRWVWREKENERVNMEPTRGVYHASMSHNGKDWEKREVIFATSVKVFHTKGELILLIFGDLFKRNSDFILCWGIWRKPQKAVTNNALPKQRISMQTVAIRCFDNEVATVLFIIYEALNTTWFQHQTQA